MDFGMAEQYNGNCYLRFDDTNPEAEKLEFIDHIQEIIKWMGWKPWMVVICSLAVEDVLQHNLYSFLEAVVHIPCYGS